jgi:hypothetical protein
MRRAVGQACLVALLTEEVPESCLGERVSMVSYQERQVPTSLASMTRRRSGSMGSSSVIGLRRRFFCFVKR